MKLWRSIRDRLVDDWHCAYKMASVWLAALAGALTAVIVANQGLLLGLLAFLPGGFWRTLIAVFVGFVVFVVPTITRLIKQPGIGGKA